VWSIQQLKTEARSEAVAAVAAAAEANNADSADNDTSDAPAIREKLLQLRGFYSQVLLFQHSFSNLKPVIIPPGCPVPLQHPHPPLPRPRCPRLQSLLRRHWHERGKQTKL
jgi:hypothetical protein